MSDDERRILFDGLIERRLPSFSIVGAWDVEDGVLAGRRTAEFFDRVARILALQVQRILLGENAAELPVAFPDRAELVINMDTARSIDALPPWPVLAEAVLLNEVSADAPLIDIRKAVNDAVATNLQLISQRLSVDAAAERVTQQRAPLLPQLDARISATRIDSDRAEAGLFGRENQTDARVGLSQLIYSEDRLARLAIERYAQTAREHDFETLRLDIARDASIRYFDVLRSKTFVDIRKENVRLARWNLELARVRETVGHARPSEVYRWENQIATARQQLLDAEAQRRRAEIELNRLLHRPLESPACHTGRLVRAIRRF